MAKLPSPFYDPALLPPLGDGDPFGETGGAYGNVVISNAGSTRVSFSPGAPSNGGSGSAQIISPEGGGLTDPFVVIQKPFNIYDNLIGGLVPPVTPFGSGSAAEIGVAAIRGTNTGLIVGSYLQSDSITRKIYKLIPEYFPSSATVWNKNLQAVSSDLEALYDKAERYLELVDNMSVSYINQLLVRIGILRNKKAELTELNQAIAEGYVDVYTDLFNSLAGIDLENSSLDFHKNAITTVRQPGSSTIDLSLANISFQVVSNIAVRYVAGLASTFEVLETNLKRNYNVVETNVSDTVIGRYILELDQSYVVNGIDLTLAKSRSPIKLTVKAGTSIADVKDVITIQDASENQSIALNATPAKYIVLEIEKNEYDTTRVDQASGIYTYLYDFSLVEIQPTVDYFCMEGVIVTKPIAIPEDVTDYNIDLLSVPNRCHHVTTELIKWDDFSLDTSKKLHSSKGSLFKKSDTSVLNIGPRKIYRKNIVQLAAVLDANTLNKTVKVFRNTKQANVIVNGVPSGWSYDGEFYTTNIYLVQELTIDFGPDPLYIDGIAVSNVQALKPGTHQIRTQRWQDIGDDYGAGIDRLYPYNHKYLIELNTGIRTIAAHVIDFVGLFDLEHLNQFHAEQFGSIANQKLFVFIPDITKDEAQEWRKEKFDIYYQRADRTFEEFILRFYLTTSDNRIPPVMNGFVVKFS